MVLQRGRDHGLPGYNKYKEICTGEKAQDFSDLARVMDPENVKQLQSGDEVFIILSYL